MGELSGKVAIVTGASKGIGAAIARRFAAAGASVAVNYGSDKAGAERVVEEIVGKGGKAIAIQANVSKGADVKRLFAETKAKLGQPTILVNNAGVFNFAPIEAVTEEDVERQFGDQCHGHAAHQQGSGRDLQRFGRKHHQSKHDREREPRS